MALILTAFETVYEMELLGIHNHSKLERNK